MEITASVLALVSIQIYDQKSGKVIATDEDSQAQAVFENIGHLNDSPSFSFRYVDEIEQEKQIDEPFYFHIGEDRHNIGTLVEKYKDYFSLIVNLYKQYGYDKEKNHGSKRMVFFDSEKKKAYKLPKKLGGEKDNLFEASLCQKQSKQAPSKDDIKIAQCHLLTLKGGPVLEMKMLSFHNWDPDTMPAWVDYIPGCQIGRNQEGEWVAYDLG